MNNIIIILFAVYFCYRSFRDFSGEDKMIKKEYRSYPGRKKWQKNKAILEIIIGLGTILFVFFQKIKVAVIAIGSVVFLAFILTIINNRNYIRQSKAGNKS